MPKAVKLGVCCVGPGISLCLPGKSCPQACRRETPLLPHSAVYLSWAGKDSSRQKEAISLSPDAASSSIPQEPSENKLSPSPSLVIRGTLLPVWRACCLGLQHSLWYKKLSPWYFPISLLNVLLCHVWPMVIKDKYLGLLHIVSNAGKRHCHTFKSSTQRFSDCLVSGCLHTLKNYYRHRRALVDMRWLVLICLWVFAILEV